MMGQTEQNHTSAGNVLSFDPIVVIRDVAKKWLAIVLIAVMAGVAAYIYTDRSYQPTYSSSATFVVTARGSSTTVYANLSSTSSVAAVFTELLSSSLMRQTVMEELGVTQLDATISTGMVDGTNLINLYVTSSDPRTAFQVAQAVIDRHETLTYQVVDGVVMEVLQYPTVAYGPNNYADAPGAMKKAMIMAALAACAVLAALSWMKNTVRSSTEAQNRLDCDYLGDIPHEQKYKTLPAALRRKKTSILITQPDAGFRFVESVRKLRRKVEQQMKDDRVLMVTSLLENEGKSTVSVNLALSMAQKHGKVLLIDCDLRKPACHAVLDCRDFSVGIREVLLGEAKPEQAVVRYRNTHLDLLLTDQSDRRSGDLISSEQMRALLQWAKAHYDFVVLDLPPMAGVSDTESMTALADASLLVVRQNTANADALNKAIAALEKGNARLLGCVLNNMYTTQMFSGMGYGYGYGYGYGHYGRYGHYGHYGHYGRYGAASEKK